MLLAGLLGGLAWDLGDNLTFVFVHLVLPMGLACLVGFSLSAYSRRCQFGVVLGACVVAQCSQLLAYGVCGNGWWYLLHDGETHLVILVSFAEQVLLSTILLAAIIFVRGKTSGRRGQALISD